MGLQSQLNDVSSDSIPLLLVALIANCLGYLRNLFFDLLHSTARHHRTDNTIDGGVGILGSGLANLILLAEQLNLNKILSYRYCFGCGGKEGAYGSDCVVCLCKLRDGEQVRKLDCCHVFHKDCFDAWLHHLNFNCPLCRSPLEIEQRVDITRRRVTDDLLAWFSMRWLDGWRWRCRPRPILDFTFFPLSSGTGPDRTGPEGLRSDFRFFPFS